MSDLFRTTTTIDADGYADPLTAPLPAQESTALATTGEVPALIGEGAGAVLAAIMQLATNPAIDVDRIDKLIQLQERMEDRQAIREFTQALVKMQSNLPRVKRDGTLQYPMNKSDPDGEQRFISHFAKWETIHAAIMPVLTDHGFSLTFKIKPRTQDGGGLGVSAVLRHVGGHVEEGDPFPVPLDTSGGKNNLQGYGSSLSYGKKYAAYAALNIATEDDNDARDSTSPPVTESQAETLTKLCKDAGRQESTFLKTMVSNARSFEEVEAKDFERLANTLSIIIDRKKPKASETEGS